MRPLAYLTATACICAQLAIGLCYRPAWAQEVVPAPTPPADTTERIHYYKRWPCTFETETGTKEAVCYVATDRQSTPIARLDADGDGCVGRVEFMLLSENWGKCDE